MKIFMTSITITNEISNRVMIYTSIEQQEED